MPYEVSQLIKDVGTPIAATPDEPIQDALDRMLHHSFSQLPVVRGDGQSRQFYFITHESILMALHNFGSRIEGSGLHVADALVRVPNVYRATDDLFELLAGMRELNAALIVDDERNLTHIVTSYDTTRYFRQWAEDIMQVRDVEHGLRRIINNAFRKADGEIDKHARRTAIEEMTSSNRALRNRFRVALNHYITQQAAAPTSLTSDWLDRAFMEMLNGCSDVASAGDNDSTVPVLEEVSSAAIAGAESASTSLFSASQALRKSFEAGIKYYLSQQATAEVILDEELVEEAFLRIHDRTEQLKKFSELTLGDYVQLFFKEVCWDRCQGVIRLNQEEVRHMLEGVRVTRNELAHFREEGITTQQRLQLRTCADWLSERENLINAAFEETAPT